jgi:uncharacterized protein
MQIRGRRRLAIKILWCLAIFILLLNIITYIHAYRFTHFSNVSKVRTTEKLSTTEKLKVLFTGIKNPRPVNKFLPAHRFETVRIKSNVTLEAWVIKAANAKGTILLFHGYGAEKSSMLDKADEFLKLCYNVMLVDFMGSGGSEGESTTIGYKEAQEVKDCFAYQQQRGEKNIHLFGTSMGAVAIMKAIRDYKITPSSVIIECPFATMYQTVCARFRIMNVPAFPMAGMLMFWGGMQNGFWPFSHNPEEYAKAIAVPTLLLYGERDNRVSREEINQIYHNLQGSKTLATYPLAGHENYLSKYRQKWVADVKSFLQRFTPGGGDGHGDEGDSLSVSVHIPPITGQWITQGSQNSILQDQRQSPLRYAIAASDDRSPLPLY